MVANVVGCLIPESFYRFIRFPPYIKPLRLPYVKDRTREDKALREYVETGGRERKLNIAQKLNHYNNRY